MARIRTIKPEMAKHEGLFDLERETGMPIRFAWAMLQTACDREGRFHWRPRTLKADILPHDDIDFSRVLDAWLTRAYLVKYRVGDEWFGWVPTFRKHQVVNPRESASVIPPVEEANQVVDYRNQQHGDASATREAREVHAGTVVHVHARGEGNGMEGNGREGEGNLRSSSQELLSSSPPEGVQGDETVKNDRGKTETPDAERLRTEITKTAAGMRLSA